ncbi:hypothetical protein LCGC14_0613980 [marine sediment metagenome]|uniref:Uncharacterized protein n=1 Tax=marine sediment metagenome TaxID=412755 RepID=A0A0F9UFD4_9ZZZZ
MLEEYENWRGTEMQVEKCKDCGVNICILYSEDFFRCRDCHATLCSTCYYEEKCDECIQQAYQEQSWIKKLWDKILP